MSTNKLAAELGRLAATNVKTVSPVSRIVKSQNPSVAKWTPGHTYQGSTTKAV